MKKKATEVQAGWHWIAQQAGSPVGHSGQLGMILEQLILA